MLNNEQNDDEFASTSILMDSGITRVSDMGEEGRLRALADQMVEVSQTEPGRDTPQLSGNWLTARGWSVMFLPDHSSSSIASLCEVLAHHGGSELFGVIVDPHAAEKASIWRIPNEPDEEGVPYGNFSIACSGSSTLIFPNGGEFCILADEEAYAVVLAGPPELLRGATGYTPSEALARFLASAHRNEAANGYPPGIIAKEAERYAPYLLRG